MTGSLIQMLSATTELNNFMQLIASFNMDDFTNWKNQVDADERTKPQTLDETQHNNTSSHTNVASYHVNVHSNTNPHSDTGSSTNPHSDYTYHSDTHRNTAPHADTGHSNTLHSDGHYDTHRNTYYHSNTGHRNTRHSDGHYDTHRNTYYHSNTGHAETYYYYTHYDTVINSYPHSETGHNQYYNYITHNDTHSNTTPHKNYYYWADYHVNTYSQRTGHYDNLQHINSYYAEYYWGNPYLHADYYYGHSNTYYYYTHSDYTRYGKEHSDYTYHSESGYTQAVHRDGHYDTHRNTYYHNQTGYTQSVTRTGHYDTHRDTTPHSNYGHSNYYNYYYHYDTHRNTTPHSNTGHRNYYNYYYHSNYHSNTNPHADSGSSTDVHSDTNPHADTHSNTNPHADGVYSQVMPHSNSTTHNNVGFDHQNYIPAKPRFYDLTDNKRVKGTITIAFYSYDKNKDNVGSTDSISKTVLYKLEIKKIKELDGTPVSDNYTILQDWSTNETYILDTTTLSEGYYELRATPKNDSISANGITKEYIGVSETVIIKVEQNIVPDITVENADEFINFYFSKEGAVNPTTSMFTSYLDGLYADASESQKEGLFVKIRLEDEDNDQYHQGTVYLQNGTNKLTATEVPITWTGSTVTQDKITRTGVAFIPATSFDNLDLQNVKVVIEVRDYLDSGYTQPTGEQVIQYKVSNTDLRDMIIDIDTIAPTISIDNPSSIWENYEDINFSVSDVGSGIKEIRYKLTNDTNKPTTWDTTTLTNNTISITTEGQYYLHVEVEDNAGNITYQYKGVYKVAPITINASTNDPIPASENLTVLVNTDCLVDLEKVEVWLEGYESNKITLTKSGSVPSLNWSGNLPIDSTTPEGNYLLHVKAYKTSADNNLSKGITRTIQVNTPIDLVVNAPSTTIGGETLTITAETTKYVDSIPYTLFEGTPYEVTGNMTLKQEIGGIKYWEINITTNPSMPENTYTSSFTAYAINHSVSNPNFETQVINIDVTELKLENLRITDITDYNWEDEFRNISEVTAKDMPIYLDKQQNYIKLGYKAKLKIDSIGLTNANDRIDIVSNFYLLDNKGNLIPVDVYVQDTNGDYVKIDSSQYSFAKTMTLDDTNKKPYEYDAGQTSKNTWEFEYYIPYNAKVVDLGQPLDIESENYYKQGKLLVVMNITGIRDSDSTTYDYTNKEANWETDNGSIYGQNRPSGIKGAILYFDIEETAKDDLELKQGW